MKKFVGLVIFLILFAQNDVFAQKGRSYSSGSKPSSSSFSKPSSSFSKPSTSFSKPSTPSFSKPSSTKPLAPSGKSYSSGSSTKPSSSPPPSAPKGKSYSSGSNSSPPPSPSSVSKKPNSSTELSKSASKEASRIRYEAATKPKETYKTPTGATKPVKADSPQVTTVRKYVTHERYVTYDHRGSTFYGSYWGHPQPYNDFFSPFLMGYLLSDAINSHQRALWMYHQRPVSQGGTIDDARYTELLKKDAKLQAELDALKAQNLARDPNYIPPQYAENPDLLYDKGFIDASYNPQEVHTAGPSGGGVGFWTILLWILGIAAVFGVIYFFCIHEW